MTPVLAEKIKTFTKLAVSKVAELEDKLAEYQDREEEAELQKMAFLKACKQAGRAMYESDFITDDDGESFVKKAQDNPAYLAQVIKKLCEASDVMSMGKVANVSSISDRDEDYDPVKARAFGHTRKNAYSILDD